MDGDTAGGPNLNFASGTTGNLKQVAGTLTVVLSVMGALQGGSQSQSPPFIYLDHDTVSVLEMIDQDWRFVADDRQRSESLALRSFMIKMVSNAVELPEELRAGVAAKLWSYLEELPE